PTQYVNTTPTMIGPITLVASIEGPRESLNNHFGNAPIASNNETHVPVGGVILQVDMPLTVGEAAASNALMLIIVAAGAIALTLVINKKQK
ncbi:MAG: hypothetical protein ABC612_08420, partial [Candidatus Methanosuratincola petrocarbonis]